MLTLVCLSLAEFALAVPGEDVYSRFADNIVTLDTYDQVLIKTRQGSGLIVERNTGNGMGQVLHGPWILTNYHVIERAGLIVVTARDGTKSNAWVISFDRDRDIALIQTHVPLKFSTIVAAPKTKVGSEVFAIGTPKGLGWTLSNGVVSALRKKADQEVVQISAPMSPGSSGGGLFAATGELLGITSFDVKGGQNLNFAVRITPEFLGSLAQFRGRGAQVPTNIPESDWVTGYTEPSAFDPDHPLATPTWHLKWERMRSWDAHVHVIETIEKRLSKVTNAMSPIEKTEQKTEWLKELKTGRPSANLVNRLEIERDQAYASRYHEFPDDIEGWAYESLQLINRGAAEENVLAMRRAIKRWPTNKRVLLHLLIVILNFKDEVAPSVRNTLFQHVEDVVTRLPTRREVNDLLKSFEKSGRVDLPFLECHINALVRSIYGFPGHWPPEKLGLSNRRQAKLDDRLRQKDWLPPKSSPSALQAPPDPNDPKVVSENLDGSLIFDNGETVFPSGHSEITLAGGNIIKVHPADGSKPRYTTSVGSLDQEFDCTTRRESE